MRDLNFSSSKELRLFFKTEKFNKIFVICGEKSFHQSGAKKLLNDRYTLISAPDKKNMRWVLARPKNLANDNPTIELGINSNGLLTELISLDIFGRSSRIILTNISWNEIIKDVAFVPVIPSGVQYLKQ